MRNTLLTMKSALPLPALRRIALGLGAALAVLAFSPAALASSLLELNIGIHRIHAEVANTSPTRSKGLMQRKQLATNQGMLFVFVQPGIHCMWMRNTLIPLSVAFIDEQGRILNIEEMQPQTEDQHCASQPAKYALEMNAGWFAQRGFKAGTLIGGMAAAPAGY